MERSRVGFPEYARMRFITGLVPNRMHRERRLPIQNILIQLTVTETLEDYLDESLLSPCSNICHCHFKVLDVGRLLEGMIERVIGHYSSLETSGSTKPVKRW